MKPVKDTHKKLVLAHQVALQALRHKYSPIDMFRTVEEIQQDNAVISAIVSISNQFESCGTAQMQMNILSYEFSTSNGGKVFLSVRLSLDEVALLVTGGSPEGTEFCERIPWNLEEIPQKIANLPIE